MSSNEPGGLYSDGPQHGFAQPDGSYWGGPSSGGSFSGSTYEHEPVEPADTSYGDHDRDWERERYRDWNDGDQPYQRPPGRSAAGDSISAGIVVSLLGFGLAGLLLWIKQGRALSETRAVLGIFLPDAWFEAGNTVGFVGLRSFVLSFTVVGFIVLTLVRWVFTRAAARTEDKQRLRAVVFCLTLLRTVLIVEASVVLFWAAELTNPNEADREPFGAPMWSWPWFVTAVLPWIVIVLIVLGASINSMGRALKRAETIEEYRRR